MNEDITFCYAVCERVSCPINKKHIVKPIPHSFAVFEGTEECEKHSEQNSPDIQPNAGGTVGGFTEDSVDQ